MLSSFCNRVLKNNIFPGKLPVHSTECLQLVLCVIASLWVQENLHNIQIKSKHGSKKHLCFAMQKSFEFTFMILEPSSLYRTRFPTISAGWTTSSSMASCTAVRVRDRGLCAAEPFFGGRTIRLVAMKTTSC